MEIIKYNLCYLFRKNKIPDLNYDYTMILIEIIMYMIIQIINILNTTII